MPDDETLCNYPVAYFSAEYGLQADLPLYAGGLGVLSGDTVKEAADRNIGMVAVGLLYRGTKAVQSIDKDGWQTESDFNIDPVSCGFEHVYAVDDEDQPLFIKVPLKVHNVWARIWKRTVNKTTLYLLDTETDQNDPSVRQVSRALYYGSEDVLVQQQLLLGIGGVRLLDELGIWPCVYHVNEGRPAFLYWQLILMLMKKQKLGFGDAASKAKSMIVYTNHTLVRAGNQAYNTDLLKKYGVYYAEKMGVSIDELLKPGIDNSSGGKFGMTQFALNTSSKASAVSQVHYEMSKSLWPEFDWTGITNGVHMPTWQHRDVRDCNKSGDDLWHVHLHRKRELMEFVKTRTGFGYDPDWLVISWARRIAGYKRPSAIFEDIDRTAKIFGDEKRPVMFLMSGKAHATDVPAKKMLQGMIGHMQNKLSGHSVYVPNYDIDVAKMLVAGSDVWMNTPIMGNEASGTSGMKAAANGVLQLTVEDGWAAEVEWHDIGWTLDSNNISKTIYFSLEESIVPLFYKRDDNNIPQDWLLRMKKTIEVSKRFSATRMLEDYQEKLYKRTA